MNFIFTADDFNTMWYCVDSEAMNNTMENLSYVLGEIYDQMKNHNIDSVTIHLEV